MIELSSPNFNRRPENTNIDMLVIHYTGMKTAKDALDKMCDITAQVSAHYMIDEDGTLYSLVPEEKRAWHAGISCWRGRANINDNSIGIELVNPGHEFGYRSFTETQMLSLIDLALKLIVKYDIPARNIVGHSDIAPNRKDDPGELFNWRQLAQNGIGLWPDCSDLEYTNNSFMSLKREDRNNEVLAMQRSLYKYGYFLRDDGYFGPKTEYTVKAFRRHFIQHDLAAVWDAYCQLVLKKLLKML